MNEGMIARVVLELQKLPLEIRDVFLMVNCRGLTGESIAGSNIINVGSSQLYLDYMEKMILLAEFVKKLEIRVEDLATFLRGNV